MITTTPVAPGSVVAQKKVSSVTVSVGEAKDGRIPVTVGVVPLEDLEVSAVFVDFRLGSKEPAETHDTTPSPEAHSTSIIRGNEAIAALAKAEAEFSNESPAVDPKTPLAAKAKTEKVESGTPIHEATAAAASTKSEQHQGKRPLISHQIGKARKLVLGQAETVRADVTAPNEAAADGTHWYIRGRFSADEGRDLRSAWVRV